MSKITGIPLGFGNLSLVLEPSFKVVNPEKLDNVSAVFYYNDLQLDSYTISTDILQINTATMDPKKPEEPHDTDINGKIYIDTNGDKIIFDGTYIDPEKKSAPFWLEIDPYPDFKYQHVDIADCPAYPASIGDLSFSVAPLSNSNGTKINSHAEEGVIFELIRRQSERNPDKITYLYTNLFESKKVSGIDTFIANDPTKDVVRVDFAGNVGISRGRLYIDGSIKINDVICSHFYLEMGI